MIRPQRKEHCARQVVTRVRYSFIGGENLSETNLWEDVSIYIILSFLLAERREVSLSMINCLVSAISSRLFSSTRFNTVGRRSNESPWNIILVPFASDLPRVSCILLTGFHALCATMIYRLSFSIDQSRGSNLSHRFSSCIFPRLSLSSNPRTLKIVKNMLIYRC